MKKKTKIVLIVLCIILVFVIVGLIWTSRTPALKDGVIQRSAFDTSRMYIVGQMPVADDPMQTPETREGIEGYWNANHKYANAIEVPLQVSKDGQIVVLSGDLSESDAESLYGKNNASVALLTLDQLQNVNLLYNVKDESGEYAYRAVSDLAKPSVSVMSLSEYLEIFNDGNKISALLIFRFADESKVSGWTSVLDNYYIAVTENDMASNSVLCMENSGGVKYFDEAYTGLLRAATQAELRSLRLSCKLGIEKQNTPYVLVYPDTLHFFGEQKFVHYAKNCGLAVILPITDAQEQDILTLRANGVNALATHDPQTATQLLKDVLQAEKESRTNAD